MRPGEDLVVQAIAGAKLNIRSGYYRVYCPFCPTRHGSTDKKQSLKIKALTGVYYCYRCHISGAAPSITSGIAPQTRREVERHETDEEKEAKRPPPGYFPLWEGSARTSEVTAPARQFLAKRGLDEDKIRRYQIGVCVSGPHCGRVIVPILTEDGKAWMGWIGRSWIKKSKAPYRYPIGMEREGMLFNGGALWVETDEPCYIVEGGFDAIWLDPDGVGVLGVSVSDAKHIVRSLITTAQEVTLMKAKRPVVIAADGDAWQDAVRLVNNMRMNAMLGGLKHFQCGAVRIAPGLDPDEVPVDELRRAARQSLKV